MKRKELNYTDLLQSCGYSVPPDTPVYIVKQALYDIIATLTPREEKILKLRYGLGADGNSHTFAATGEAVGISDQRAWTGHRKALRKLWHDSRRKRFAAFLEEATRV